MSNRQRACVYCGSSEGNDPAYASAAVELAETLVRHNYDLVFGGGSIGIMRIVADAVLNVGGSVTGVIPQSLVDREVAHDRLTELHVTSSMHERKALMADLSDVFIALPGGLGTLEELFEIWTWTQLGFHQKPVAILNTMGYFNNLLDFLDKAVESGFVKSDHRNMLVAESDADALLQKLSQHQPTDTDKLAD